MSGGLVVVDHTDPWWADRYHRAYVRHGRENGAHTYSREVVQHHIPVWSRFAGEGTVISTCPPLYGCDVEGGLAVQYLHETAWRGAEIADKVADYLRDRFVRTVFVTSHRALSMLLQRRGFETLWVPMAVDVPTIQATAVPQADRYDEHRAVYFGNITPTKQDEYAALDAEFLAAGWLLDVISDSRFNETGPVLDQAQAWRIASRYRFGVGVGRCALELAALGCRVMVSGARFGGLVTTPAEWAVQSTANFAGSVVTFSADRATCIAAFDRGLEHPASNGIPLALEHLRDGLIGLWDRGVFRAA